MDDEIYLDDLSEEDLAELGLDEDDTDWYRPENVQWDDETEEDDE